MSFKKGQIAEDEAIIYLQKLEFMIIDRNFNAKFGEIDIVAKKDDVIHFVEVKSGKIFEPIYNITPIKIARLTKTIEIYLKKKNLDFDYQLDAVIIEDGEIQLYENITL